MKAISVAEGNGPESLVLRETSDPACGDGEVLVAVEAAGVNRADILQRQGHYPPPAGASAILGLEVSGTVVAIGTAVEGWRIGDRVCALLNGGGYAERVAVPAGQLLPAPSGLSLADAAALPEALCTVFHNLFLKADLQPGETLLVHGGASGIGTAAVQFAKAHGVRVACTAGSAEKLAAARSCGADILIDYKQEDFAERLRAEGGADVILDIIGAKYLARNVDALKVGGRLVVIGLQGGRKAELDLARLLAKQGSVFATSLRALDEAGKGRIVAGVRQRFWPLVEDGRYRPVIHETLPFADAARAHARIERGDATGKILLQVA
jgi:putative PIG3 family NAD(P)H quinone oxidoreductase